MELLLAGNHGSFSNHFLKLGKHVELHGFKIMVDEILTSGQVTTPLTTHSKLKEWCKMVSCITIGKWTKCGVVFTSVVHNKKKY